MKHLIIILILALPMMVQAQNQDEDEYPRRWAIDGQIGAAITGKGKTTGNNISGGFGLGDTNSGLLSKLHFEYYIPNTKFSVKLGYEHEELNFMRSDISYDTYELMAGGRWYPAPNWWVIQPYVGIDALWNMDHEDGNFTMSMSSYGTGYTRTGCTKLPIISLAPVAGADIYIFSCIAIQAEYGYRMGIDSHIDVNSHDNGNRHMEHSHFNVHRHTLNIGLKITFPFSFSERDTKGLLDYFFENY